MRNYIGFPIFSLLFLLLLTGPAVGQDCTDAADRLYAELLKTASGKTQIRGEQRKKMDELLGEVKTRVAGMDQSLGCFVELTNLVQPIRDNHLHFYEERKVTVVVDSFRSREWIESYRASTHFTNFPMSRYPIDSLQQVLSKKEAGGVEGVYYLGRHSTIGIVRMENSDTLEAVMLTTELPTWKAGQLIARMWPVLDSVFSVLYADLLQKNWNFYRYVRRINGDVPLMGFRRDTTRKMVENLPDGTETFAYRRLQNKIDYLRLGSFSVFEENRKKAQTFLSNVRDSLTGSALIVDLRNNGGGAFKTSRPFLRLIKKKARKQKVILLVNYHTVSNAEQVLIRLRGQKNIRVAGQPTRGMITYGNNTGKRVDVGNYKLYITDMKGSKRDLRYEDSGVPPDWLLTTDADWIDQVLDRLQAGRW